MRLISIELSLHNRFVVFRYIGTVFATKPKKGIKCRVRVKFDMYPKDKYDKW